MPSQLRLHSTYQQHNVFRRPEWRFERVLSLVDHPSGPRRGSRHDDPLIRAARGFLLRYRNMAEGFRDDLFWENRGLFYAYEIYEKILDEPEPAALIQARLLARQTYEEIAQALGTLPETILWYEALFFNVTDRLDNRDWITKHVLMPAFLRHHKALLPDPDQTQSFLYKDSTVAKPFLDASLKLFAYFGGKYLVDVMITGFEAGRPLQSAEQMAAWFDNVWSSSIRRRSSQAALQFEVNKYNVMELFAVHAKIKELESSEDNQEKQRSLTERHVKALLDELPFTVGEAGARMLKGTVIGEFDEGEAELRDDELLRTAAGEDPELLRATVIPLRIPPPRRKPLAALDKPPEL